MRNEQNNYKVIGAVAGGIATGACCILWSLYNLQQEFTNPHATLARTIAVVSYPIALGTIIGATAGYLIGKSCVGNAPAPGDVENPVGGDEDHRTSPLLQR